MRTDSLHSTSRHALKSAFAALSVIAVAGTIASAQTQDDALTAKAREIHKRVMTLDTHVDINPSLFRKDSTNYTSRLASTQVDLAKMDEGGLDAAFLAVYVGQATVINDSTYARAYAQAMEKFAAIHRLTDTIAPDKTGLALTSADARRIYASGKKVIFIGIENAFPVGTDIGNVKKFADLGGRYMSLAHNGHSQMSDSNTGERDGIWAYKGLSPLGRQAIAEMNKWGIMIDISHPSRESMMQTLAITKAPIIASHSGVRAICNVSRNLDDEQLKALKVNKGVVQLVAFRSYVKCNPALDAKREEALTALRKEYGITATNRREQTSQIEALAANKRSAFMAAQANINDKLFPAAPRATVQDFVDHIDYTVKLIGVDHVGISSDFDGGGGVEGWNSATETFNVTKELVKRGYSEKDIEKIWSGNLLRVLDDVQKVAKGLQK